MPLNSFLFLLVFLPTVFIIQVLLRKNASQRWVEVWLLAASLFFYGCAGFSQFPVLLGSIAFNWWIARKIVSCPDEAKRKWVLQIGLGADIALLCFIKYSNFLLGTIRVLHGPQFAPLRWGLPLGVSFFTLTQVMYLVDTYQRLTNPNSLLDHAILVSFFPYVTAGPLVRSKAIVPQFAQYKIDEPKYERACRGLYLFSIGLAKKVIFADSFSRIADAGFKTTSHASTLEAWIFILSYTFQIYFDFSGYSDMAVGSAWVLGIDIPQNFNAPYRSKSISEFWRRWHISLSNFITDYLYTPILRSMGRATLATSAIATLIAMGIVGLWHGPAWTFVVFGLLHGAALAINQFWRKRKLIMPEWLAWSITFVFVNIAFCCFRAPSIPFAMHLLKLTLPQPHWFGMETLNTTVFRSDAVRMIIGAVVAFAFKTSSEMAASFRPTRMTAGVTAVLLVLSWYFMDSSSAKQFIYRGF